MCSPLQGCVDIAPRFTKGVAALLTVTAIAAVALGASYLITRQSPLKFFNHKWAVGCVAGGVVTALIGINILLREKSSKKIDEKVQQFTETHTEPKAPPNTPATSPAHRQQEKDLSTADHSGPIAPLSFPDTTPAAEEVAPRPVSPVQPVVTPTISVTEYAEPAEAPSEDFSRGEIIFEGGHVIQLPAKLTQVDTPAIPENCYGYDPDNDMTVIHALIFIDRDDVTTQYVVRFEGRISNPLEMIKKRLNRPEAMQEWFPVEAEQEFHTLQIGDLAIHYPQSLNQTTEDSIQENSFFTDRSGHVRIKARYRVGDEHREICFLTASTQSEIIEKLWIEHRNLSNKSYSEKMPSIVMDHEYVEESARVFSSPVPGKYYRNGDQITLTVRFRDGMITKEEQLCFTHPEHEAVTLNVVLLELISHHEQLRPVQLLKEHLEKEVFYHVASGTIATHHTTLKMTPLEFTAQEDTEKLKPGEYKNVDDGNIKVCVGLQHPGSDDIREHTFTFVPTGHPPTTEDIMREFATSLRAG